MKTFRGTILTKIFQYSSMDVYYFGKLSQDSNPIHYDEKFAESTQFKKPIVQGMLVASSFGGLIGSNFPNCIYLSQNLIFKAPIFIEEKVVSSVEVSN